MGMIALFAQIMFVIVGLLSSDANANGANTKNTRICLKSCAPGYVCRINDMADSNGWSDSCEPASGTTGQPAACVSQLNSLAEKCESEIAETTHACDEKSDSGMNGVANTASQLSLMFGQQTAASITAACSKMAALTSAANAAVAAYRMNCNSALTGCKSACGQLLEYARSNAECLNIEASGAAEEMISNAEGRVARCNDFDAKIQEANQAIKNFTGTLQNAAQCASLTAGDSTLPAICASNPSLPGCDGAGTVDCTKPEMATNKVCVCSKNPTDPMCVNANSVGSGVSAIGSVDSSSRLNSNAGTEGFGGDLPALPGIAHGKPGSGGAGEAVDGRQGGGAGLSSFGGGGGGGGSSGGQGSDGSSNGVAVNAGFYGGGGSSMGRYGSGGGGAAGAGAGRPGTPGSTGASMPNLRKFLPGGAYDPKRGISGVAGPDGITGPHSNIWQKIQNRYRVMSPTLLP